MKLTISDYENGGKSLNNFINYIIDNNDSKIYREYNFSDESASIIDSLINFYFNRKEYILDEINDCLSDGNIIDSDGFINFRLCGYNHELRRAIDKVISKINAVTEYKSYIQTVKKLISEGNCMVKTLNIYYENRRFIIRDGEFKVLNDICKRILDEEFNYNFKFNEDFLLSAVITLAPKKIILHSYDKINNFNVIKTLKEIYGDNISVCDGCFICKI